MGQEKHSANLCFLSAGSCPCVGAIRKHKHGFQAEQNLRQISGISQQPPGSVAFFHEPELLHVVHEGGEPDFESGPLPQHDELPYLNSAACAGAGWFPPPAVRSLRQYRRSKRETL